MHQKAYETLYKLASLSDPSGSIAIIRNGGIEVIVKGIWGMLEVRDVQLTAMNALWAIASSGAEIKPQDTMEEFAAFDVIDVVLISMQSHEKDASIQLAGCCFISCLANISLQTNESDKRNSSCYIFTIASAMKNYSTRKDMQEWGTRALFNICSLSDSNKIFFVSNNYCGSDGIDLVNNALKSFSSDLTTLEWACRFSFSLSLNEETAKIISSSSEFIETVVNILKNYRQRKDFALLVEAGCGILANLGMWMESNILCDLIHRTEGIEAILDAMIFFVQSEFVQVHACSVLSALVVNAQSRGVIWESEGMETLLILMNKYPSNDLLQERICRIICSLCIGYLDAKELLLADDVLLSATTRALESNKNSTGVQEAGCALQTASHISTPAV